MDFYTNELSSRYIYLRHIYSPYSAHIGEERARTFGGYRSEKDKDTDDEESDDNESDDNESDDNESDDNESDDEEWSPETRIVSRKVDTTEYSMDVLVGKMSRMTIEDKKAEDPEEVIVWKGEYIVCD
jgi:hypothetical protein